jgi:hypothetical protein
MGKRSDRERARIGTAYRRQKKRLPVSEQEPLPLWPEKVEGGRLVRELERYVQSLRDESAHGNRQLFLDDVFLAYLLAFFNPTLRSLRTIEDFSQTRQAQRHLSTRRICRSTLSDFNQLADPTRLEPILMSLRAALSRKSAGQGRSDLQGLVKQVLAVDGTFFSAAADVAWAIGHRNQTATSRYRARLDAQINIATWLPEVISVPEPGEGEAKSAAQFVQPGAIHIYDRAYGSFELLNAHYELRPDRTLEPRAEFVLRAKSHQLSFTAIEDHPLSEEQRRLGIVSDRIGHLIGSQGYPAPSFAVREIVFVKEDGEAVRLLTNLLEVAAETVTELYRQRWQIELFFRWLKCYAHFDHLISHSRSGVLLNFYVVVIGVLLMYLHTGGRPSKYALVLLGMVAHSGASLDSILPILRERERQCERDRKSAAARRARKKAASQ